MSGEKIVNALRLNVAGARRVGLYPGKSRLWGMMEQAADLIEDQQNHIRALMQANDALRSAWVPVTERLPETTVCVLVAYSNGMVEVDAWGHDGWMDEDLSNGTITHWMPLPSVPVEVQNA